MAGFVLLSGGIDSSTALALAVNVHGFALTEAVSIDYGQRHKREIEAAKAVAEHYHVRHTVLTLGGQPKSMLTSRDEKIPSVSYSDIVGVSPTYVYFRNGQMLSALAAWAHAVLEARSELHGGRDQQGGTIYFGAHAEDAERWAYPDCTPEFCGAMANAIYIGTYHKLRLAVPFQYSSKADIVRQGVKLGVPYGLTWSCYAGEELHCGVCPTCRARREAFTTVAPDPTQYATPLVTQLSA